MSPHCGAREEERAAARERHLEEEERDREERSSSTRDSLPINVLALKAVSVSCVGASCSSSLAGAGLSSSSSSSDDLEFLLSIQFLGGQLPSYEISRPYKAILKLHRRLEKLRRRRGKVCEVCQDILDNLRAFRPLSSHCRWPLVWLLTAGPRREWIARQEGRDLANGLFFSLLSRIREHSLFHLRQCARHCDLLSLLAHFLRLPPPQRQEAPFLRDRNALSFSSVEACLYPHPSSLIDTHGEEREGSNPWSCFGRWWEEGRRRRRRRSSVICVEDMTDYSLSLSGWQNFRRSFEVQSVRTFAPPCMPSKTGKREEGQRAGEESTREDEEEKDASSSLETLGWRKMERERSRGEKVEKMRTWGHVVGFNSSLSPVCSGRTKSAGESKETENRERRDSSQEQQPRKRDHEEEEKETAEKEDSVRIHRFQGFRLESDGESQEDAEEEEGETLLLRPLNAASRSSLSSSQLRRSRRRLSFSLLSFSSVLSRFSSSSEEPQESAPIDLLHSRVRLKRLRCPSSLSNECGRRRTSSLAF